MRARGPMLVVAGARVSGRGWSCVFVCAWVLVVDFWFIFPAGLCEAPSLALGQGRVATLPSTCTHTHLVGGEIKITFATLSYIFISPFSFLHVAFFSYNNKKFA